LVLLAVRCSSSRKEKQSPQYIALKRDPIIKLRQYSHAVPIFAERVGGTPEAAESFLPTSSVVIDKNVYKSRGRVLQFRASSRVDFWQHLRCQDE
jgi:hypothetical protein